MPVSSYAPEFLELFKLAAQKEQIVPLGDEKRATHMRFRLHKLRVAMRKENHSLTTIANSVQFSITPAGDLRCTPADDTFLKELETIGVTITPPPPGASSTPAPYAKPERAEAEEVLKKFFEAGKEKE